MRAAVVTPRYGPDLGGGAESLARGFAEETARQGWAVEVWTTCARDHHDWANVLPAGRSTLNGVPVERFPVTHWDRPARTRLDSRLSLRGSLPAASQYDWLGTGPHSAPLYQHIACHADRFDLLILLPYVSPLVHYAAQVAPCRIVLWPCLHDEPYAYLEPVRLLLAGAWGLVFNSPEEQALAAKLLPAPMPRQATVGVGVERTSSNTRPQPGANLLYVGRLEEGKNLRQLYRYVQVLSDAGVGIGLTVIGGGNLLPPRHPAFDYRGFVSDHEKAAAYAGALALCQPSLNESFSLVLMESWLARRPVLVNAGCAVTRGHVQRSAGGLAYANLQEFHAAIQWLRGNAGLAARMGENGCRYVERNYAWPAVVERFARVVAAWQADGGAG